MKAPALGAASAIALCASLALGARAADAPSASDAAPAPDSAPNWTHEITPERCPQGRLTHYYPPNAQAQGRTGSVVMKCRVTQEGTVDECVVVSEDPPGYGFGEAALKMSCLFKMKPKTVNGSPVGGAEVTIPLKFKLK
jgi:protein TonB